MANLFEINKAIMDAWDACIDPETGEIDESKYAEMEALQMEFDSKIENLACWAPGFHCDYMDPEQAANTGSKGHIYGWQKTFMFGIDINF